MGIFKRRFLAGWPLAALAWVALAGSFTFASCETIQSVEPVYLTWTADRTAETMTVRFVSEKDSKGSEVHYDRVPHGGDPSAYAFHASGDSKKIPGTQKRLHSVELTGLAPATDYYFITDHNGKLSPERRFRTLSANPDHLTFVTGGDMGTGPEVNKLHQVAASYSPDFALVGGDIAYAGGSTANSRKWMDWLEAWSENMITPEGRTIPVIAAIGNHEVNGKKGEPERRAPYYFTFFDQGGSNTYFARTFGRHMALSVLDTGHITEHGGLQRVWLKEALQKGQIAKYRFALYHVPLFPSVRDFDNSLSTEGRNQWLPLFEEFHLTAGFENHEHAYKRTYPISHGQVSRDGKGIVFMGDGCWGRPPRSNHPESEYLAKALSERHVILVHTSNEGVRYEAYDVDGAILDRYWQVAP